jgi:hypothetical protein
MPPPHFRHRHRVVWIFETRESAVRSIKEETIFMETGDALTGRGQTDLIPVLP